MGDAPLWQSAKYPDMPRSGWSGWAVRAIATDKAKPLLHIAALHGFWSLQDSFLKQLCKYLACAIPSGADTYDLIKILFERVLGWKKLGEIIGVMEKRSLSMAKSSPPIEQDLLNFEDASMCLGKFDKDKLVKEKEKRDSNVVVFRKFLGRVATTRTTVQKPQSKAAASAEAAIGSSKERRTATTAAFVELERRPLPPGLLEHSVVKSLIPPVRRSGRPLVIRVGAAGTESTLRSRGRGSPMATAARPSK